MGAQYVLRLFFKHLKNSLWVLIGTGAHARYFTIHAKNLFHGIQLPYYSETNIAAKCRYSHVSIVWIPCYTDTTFGDKLEKYMHFCLVLMDKSHYGRFFTGTEVSILTRHHCIVLFFTLPKQNCCQEPCKVNGWQPKKTAIGLPKFIE